MKVELKGTDCLHGECPFRRQCAQHVTAGDHRAEGGPTPDLYVERGKVYCDQVLRDDVSGSVFLRDGRLFVQAEEFGDVDMPLHGDVDLTRKLLEDYVRSQDRETYVRLQEEVTALPRSRLPPAPEEAIRRLIRLEASLAAEPRPGTLRLEGLTTLDEKEFLGTAYLADARNGAQVTIRPPFQFDETTMELRTKEQVFKVCSLYPETAEALAVLDRLAELSAKGGTDETERSKQEPGGAV